MNIDQSNQAAFKIILKAEREIAYASPNHLLPWETGWDNSHNRRLHDKLYWLYLRFHQPLKILDMGCSGGGFVKSCSMIGASPWGLKTAISRRGSAGRKAHDSRIPFSRAMSTVISRCAGATQRVYFEAVPCWEMMEYSAEPDVSKVAVNVKKPLRPADFGS